MTMEVTRRRAAAVVALLLVAASSASAQEPVALTMDEVVQRTLQHSPQVVQAQGTVQTSELTERSAFGAYLPNLNLSTNASLASSRRFDNNTGTFISGSNDSYSAGLSSAVDLFTGGRRGAEMNRARAQTAASEASLIQQRYAVTRTAKAAFFDVLRAGDLIRTSEARRTRAEGGLQAAELRQRAGSGTRSDVLRAQLELTNARQALLQAENQKRTAMFALGRLVGLDGPVDASQTEPLVVRELPFDRDQLVAMAVAQSPAVVSALADERAAQAGVRVSRSQYLPSLSLSGSYNWANDVASFSNVNGSWSTRLGLSFPVFNRFAREETNERSQVQARVAQYQLDDARRGARADIERVLGALETARQQIVLAEEALGVAEEDLRVQQERYRLNVATILEQVTSQENLVGAEINVISARYNYQLALAELEALIGREL
ncbi:MAG TPA: TolC family protein [Longimicrobiales bacterium]|nr:TolC family protein [Longimicrobiales bacterium]